MARHIMAVCVVCLICAEHLPCKEHLLTDDQSMHFNVIEFASGQTNNAWSLPVAENSPTTKMSSIYEKPKHKSKAGRRKSEEIIRLKRELEHTDHDHHDHDHDHHDDDHDHDEKSISSVFITEIFKKYGDPVKMQMNVTGFEEMLKVLNLDIFLSTEKLETKKSAQSTQTDKPNVPDAVDSRLSSTTDDSKQPKCMNSLSLLSAMPSGDQLKRSHITNLLKNYKEHSDKVVPANDTSTNFELSANATLKDIKDNLTINTTDLWTMCPILLYQLAASTSHERFGCIDKNLLPLKFDQNTFLDHFINVGMVDGKSVMNKIVDDAAMTEDRYLVWLYSSLSILGVSLCGLLGVAVIPCMDMHFYHHIIQFLVALAIGTLTGDALLHLLPHAMMTVGENEDRHTSMMFKGLAAVFGIVFFYFMERFLNISTEWWQKRQKKDKVNSRVRVIRDPESTSLKGVPSSTDKYTCKHKYSSYPYCYDEIAMETKDDHHEHHKVNNKEDDTIMYGAVASKMNHNSHTHNHNHQRPLNNQINSVNVDVVNPKCPNHGEHGDHLLVANKDIDLAKDSPIDEEPLNSDMNHDTNTISTNCDDGSIERKKERKELMPEESYTIILREHESKHHGHSHTHGHVHSPPESLSAVVWMVIMGDGLHNFTDGMAIGAAFSNNIAGGFSTAIAVFCHELPHELGDFAVLLKAGMSAKQAVYYNLLSSVLSFFGMVLGVWVGDTPAASAWIFALAAGMFLYIALVDMIPELTSSHGKEEKCIKSQFFLQFIGMACGFGTMLLIAFYEHDLKELFSSGGGHHHHH